jgi:hypothetical protein
MISFLQLHETPLSHNILNESFSESLQSCFILGEGRERKKKREGGRKREREREREREMREMRGERGGARNKE